MAVQLFMYGDNWFHAKNLNIQAGREDVVVDRLPPARFCSELPGMKEARKYVRKGVDSGSRTPLPGGESHRRL